MELYKPYPIYNKNGTILAFDVFIKNNYLYFIMPLYNNYPLYNEIKIFIQDCNVKLNKDIIKDAYEAHRILSYKIIPKFKKTIDTHKIIIIYNNRKHTFSIPSTPLFQYKDTLSLTTLCKNDYKLLPNFINYYKNQGVERFYIYYNGILTESLCTELETLIDSNTLKNIIFIEWNFPYWNNNTRHSNHHAQLSQLHHAIYYFGKQNSTYMTFCDLDEYLYISKTTSIKHLIKSKPNIHTFVFHNMWAQFIKNQPFPTKMLPNKFLLSRKKDNYRWRSKCIHKIESIKTINIHQPYGYNIKVPTFSLNYTMFHFFNLSQPNRSINDIENNAQFTEIELDKY